MSKGYNKHDFKREFLECECFYCEDTLTKKNATVEHLIPQSYGGTDDPWNIVVACGDCNSKAGRKPLWVKFAMSKNDRYKEYMVYMYGGFYTQTPTPTLPTLEI